MRRYKTDDGFSLAVDECLLTLVWITPEGDQGLTLGNNVYGDAESDVAVAACTTFFRQNGLEMPEHDVDFVFGSPNQAKKCLKTVNEALYAWKANKPLPDWAQTALAAGWKPPKGWSP